jgi:hypothetical protein
MGPFTIVEVDISAAIEAGILTLMLTATSVIAFSTAIRASSFRGLGKVVFPWSGVILNPISTILTER